MTPMKLKRGEQAELATKVGVTRQHLNAVLRGRVRCSVDLAKALERETGDPWHTFIELYSSQPAA